MSDVSNNNSIKKDPAAAWTVSKGVKDGFPICLGYFAVSFSLGIAAGNYGFTPLQGFIMSITNLASSGQYAGLLLYSENAGYLTLAIMILIANARYLLMSCAISQKFSPETGLLQRLLVGFGLTDEMFGLGISTPGYIKPHYMYSALITAALGWGLGTSAGIIAGDILPPIIAEAMNVAIFGMFLAIIIPPAKSDKNALKAVVTAFTLSLIASYAPLISGFSSGTRALILTVIISAAFAALYPVKDAAEREAEDEAARKAEESETDKEDM